MSFLLAGLQFLIAKKVTDDTLLAKLNLNKMKTQTKCGTEFTLSEKVSLTTTQFVDDYHGHVGEGNKMTLCLASTELQNAIKNVKSTLATQKGLTFKPEKKRIYLTVTEEQLHALPVGQKIQLTLSIYGVFTQSQDNLSYLQMKLDSFKTVISTQDNDEEHESMVV